MATLIIAAAGDKIEFNFVNVRKRTAPVASIEIKKEADSGTVGVNWIDLKGKQELPIIFSDYTSITVAGATATTAADLYDKLKTLVGSISETGFLSDIKDAVQQVPLMEPTHMAFPSNLTFSDNNQLHIVGMSFTGDDSDVVALWVAQFNPSTKKWEYWIEGQNAISLQLVSGELYIRGATPLITGRSYRAAFYQKPISSDISDDVTKVSIESKAPIISLDAQNVVDGADIGAVDDTWVDAGSEIDVRALESVGIYYEYTANDSAGAQLQILSLHTSGGTEYNHETSADFQHTIGDSNKNLKLDTFECKDINYLQIQTKATTVGATEGTIKINYVGVQKKT
jgi:hypothetical protein